MRLKALYIIIFSLSFQTQVLAQLSPGKLTTAHAELEGLRNCTECHTLGNKIDDNKCLACHEEIEGRIEKREGFHASTEVKGKECATCHSEHHGRNFDMVRFDQDNFDHDLTGYELTGAHVKIDCRECHQPDFIEDQELKVRKETFLGLEHDCISCHEDVHQNTLESNDCASCHSTEEFSPAVDFDHDETDYPLVGKHIEVDCIECHQKEIRNGKEFQHFADVEFANCNSCHDDVHNDQLGTDCKQCHTEESFTSQRNLRRFNHNRTKFPLKGSHKSVSCAECHQMNVSLTTLFQDRNGVKTQDCKTCHEDVHENKLGEDCASCHNEKSFTGIDTDDFNHNLTDFKLVGEHQSVDCRTCHEESLTAPLAHNTCASCHQDYHEGDFVKENVSPDCASCHNEQGFEPSTYTLEEHNESDFPLEGGHLATPCFACHLQEEKWRFKEIGEGCVDCHQDVHEGYISAEYYPSQKCESCHVVDNWTDNQFDHSLTGFELLGKHAETTCMECHGVEEAIAQHKYEGFKDIPGDCASCHDNVHEEQFAIEGVTDCVRCHGFNDWSSEDFNHDLTNFKLEGAHQNVACQDCHKPIESNGKTITQYKFKSFECVDCHQ